MKNKSFLLFIFIFNYSLSFSQDGNIWGFNFKFKLETNTIRNDFKGLELFFNESNTYEYYSNSSVKLDSLTGEYHLNISYSCVSCDYTNSDTPPEIYLKINMDNWHLYNKPYSVFIPIYFNKSSLWATTELKELNEDSYINIGTIDVKNFLIDNWYKDDDIVTYDVIELTEPNSIYYRKKNEYKPRRMNKMIKVEFEH